MTQFWLVCIAVALWAGCHPSIHGPGIAPNSVIVGSNNGILTINNPSAP